MDVFRLLVVLDTGKNGDQPVSVIEIRWLWAAR